MSASLSTHVLDTAVGGPATRVTVELLHGDELVARAETDDDGRARLSDALALGHYHVPLLVSPFSCASYRGS